MRGGSGLEIGGWLLLRSWREDMMPSFTVICLEFYVIKGFVLVCEVT